MSSESILAFRALSIVPTTIEHAAPVLYELTSDSTEIGAADDNAIVLADASIAPHHLTVRHTDSGDHVLLHLGRRRRDSAWTEFQEGDTYWCPRHGNFAQLDERDWCPQCNRRRGSLWLQRPLKPGDTFDIGTAFRATYVVEKRAPQSNAPTLPVVPDLDVDRHHEIINSTTEPATVVRALPTDDPNLWRWQPAGVPFPIFMHQRVNIATTQHARQNREREVGGVLLGEVCHDERGQMYVVVTHALKAEFADETRGHLTFTQKTWLHIHTSRERHYPDKEIVGWYHTHPGWTIFLSPWDLFIHQNFFRQPWQIALVIDPSLDRAGFFVWKDNQINQPHAPLEPFRLAELDGWAEATKPRVRIKLI